MHSIKARKQMIRRYLLEGKTYKEINTLLGASFSTIAKVKKELEIDEKCQTTNTIAKMAKPTPTVPAVDVSSSPRNISESTTGNSDATGQSTGAVDAEQFSTSFQKLLKKINKIATNKGRLVLTPTELALLREHIL